MTTLDRLDRKQKFFLSVVLFLLTVGISYSCGGPVIDAQAGTIPGTVPTATPTPRPTKYVEVTGVITNAEGTPEANVRVGLSAFLVNDGRKVVQDQSGVDGRYKVWLEVEKTASVVFFYGKPLKLRSLGADPWNKVVFFDPILHPAETAEPTPPPEITATPEPPPPEDERLYMPHIR